jgi:septal ring factor EnvC (AmiA/AmiB activator)
LEGQVAKLRAASEGWCFNSANHDFQSIFHPLTTLFWFAADAQQLQEMMDKQASLQQRLELKDKKIEDLKKKLVDMDEQISRVEAELPRGAVMAASHALGVLKSHLPDLDVEILSKGYACTPAEAQALADQVRSTVEPFVHRLGLSVSTSSEDEV